MPIRKPNPSGRVSSSSPSPHRPVLFDHDEYPTSWYGALITPYSDNEGSQSSTSSDSSPRNAGLVMPGPVSATRGNQLRDLAEGQQLLPLSYDSKFTRHPDPEFQDCNVAPDVPEDDDWLHIPEKNFDDSGTVFTKRGFASLGCLFILALWVMWMIAAPPLLYYLYNNRL